jgi:hypothetical protein
MFAIRILTNRKLQKKNALSSKKNEKLVRSRPAVFVLSETALVGHGKFERLPQIGVGPRLASSPSCAQTGLQEPALQQLR